MPCGYQLVLFHFGHLCTYVTQFSDQLPTSRTYPRRADCWAVKGRARQREQAVSSARADPLEEMPLSCSFPPWRGATGCHWNEWVTALRFQKAHSPHQMKRSRLPELEIWRLFELVPVVDSGVLNTLRNSTMA